MPYELKLTKYQGPIEKLVELIEEKKLSITELSLAEVTADFLSYVETLEARLAYRQAGTKEEGTDPVFAELLADFLVIATRLVLIKSKALLPTLPLTPEEEEDIRDLEVRVRLYQELKNLQPHVKRGWRAVPQMGTREFLLSEEAVFNPPPNLALH
ncbi:MAG: segregation/condensation protein A, partial [Candidatus Jorgensenbacteria bacterium]|nr:segregation/condensation protein A [Candidatus Jorgensenbacteria bacterium]